MNNHAERDLKERTARSFGYEWRRFSVSATEMEDNFRGYFGFLPAGALAGKRILEAGSGMGRHTYFLSELAAEVVAIDLGEAIAVTAANVAGRPNVHLAQADIDHLPFPDESFGFVCSIGVLHHLPSTEAGLGALVRCLERGGLVYVYLYWALENAPVWKRGLLAFVTMLRRITVRLPFPVVDKLAWLVAAAGYIGLSLPYRYLSRWRVTRNWVKDLPLQRYAKDGFRVCYNDQFDRLTAPLERRFTRDQVRTLMIGAGLKDVRVEPHYGWIAYGSKP